MKNKYVQIIFLTIISISTYGQCENNESLTSQNKNNDSWLLMWLNNVNKSKSFDMPFLLSSTTMEVSNLESQLNGIGYNKLENNVYQKTCKSTNSQIYTVKIIPTNQKGANNIKFITNDRKKFLSLKEDLLGNEDYLVENFPKDMWTNFDKDNPNFSKQTIEFKMVSIKNKDAACFDEVVHLFRIYKLKEITLYEIQSNACLKK